MQSADVGGMVQKGFDIQNPAAHLSKDAGMKPSFPFLNCRNESCPTSYSFRML